MFWNPDLTLKLTSLSPRFQYDISKAGAVGLQTAETIATFAVGVFWVCCVCQESVFKRGNDKGGKQILHAHTLWRAQDACAWHQ